MKNNGMIALASLVGAGRFERLEDLSLSLDDWKLTDQGVFTWTQAVRGMGKHGLPMLSHFRLFISSTRCLRFKKRSFAATALMDNCPRLERIEFVGDGDWGSLAMVLAKKVHAAGIRHRLEVKVGRYLWRD